MSKPDTKTYEVTSPFRFGGRDYAAGAAIELTRDEAKSPGLAKRIGKPGAKAAATAPADPAGAEAAHDERQKQLEELAERTQDDLAAVQKLKHEAAADREAADKARVEAAADLEAAKAERAAAEKAKAEADDALKAAAKATAQANKGGAKK